jgi:hypothetical protein
MYPPQPPGYPPGYYAPRYSGCLKFILYALSFLIPIVGFVVALVFMSKRDPESSGLGKACLAISIGSFVLQCCLGGGVVILPSLLEGTLG